MLFAILGGLRSEPSTSAPTTLPLPASYYARQTNPASLLSALSTMAGLVEGIMHAKTATASPDILLKIAESHSADLPMRPAVLRPRPSAKDVVLVTGTTGNFGTDLLENLLRDDAIERVYAVNRRGSRAMERQEASFRDRGYDEDILHSGKFRMVEGNLDAPGFDIEPALLEEIRNSVTYMIHNAWRVNFNMPVDAFDVYLRALRYLIDLALSSSFTEPPKIQYISSITVFQSCELPAPVPEVPMDPASALGTGYGESKWVGEHMLLKVAEETDVPIQIVRLAQICGGKDGHRRRTCCPASISSARPLTHGPAQLNTYAMQDAAFVPNFPAAQALIEMHTSPEQILHLTHPRSASLRSLFASVAEQLEIPLVSWDAWLHALAKTGKTIAAGEFSHAARESPPRHPFSSQTCMLTPSQHGPARSTCARSDKTPRWCCSASTAPASSGPGTRWCTSSGSRPRRRARPRRRSSTCRRSRRT
ncbi:male sterility protein-domain-containing protein [Daedaleopsis nitida]|nr:male sterility protein-domain-containing protein [Daedaleopsis nitida]